MNRQRDTYCSYCGTAYVPPLRYPRTCASCSTQVWSNPIPVAVVLLPVRVNSGVGLLTIRRGIEPQIGKLALVGGFVEDHESWQAGAAREMREEAGVQIDAAALKPEWFVSTEPKPNRILMFASAPMIEAPALGTFAPNHEVTERGVIFGPDGLDQVFAFSLHAKAAAQYFAEQRITGPHEFVRC